MIELLAALLGGAAGAIAGSFLATLILRWPDGRGIAKGRSACDRCGRTLAAIDLIPIVSALAARGRCRTCSGRIDPLHSQVETTCAFIGALALGLMPGVEGLGWALFGWIGLTLAILDWRHFWLPDALTLPLALLGLTIGPWVTHVAVEDAFIGAAAGYLALLMVALSYRLIRRRDGLGLGDAKLFGALGGWFGWQALPLILLFAASLGLVAVLAAMAKGHALDQRSKLPLGTCLILAAAPGWWVSALLY